MNGMNTVRQILAALPAEPTPMLPPACYTDPAFFRFERRAVFVRSWTCVGRVEQI